MSPAEIIDKAADHIDRHGWFGCEGRAPGSYCIATAINAIERGGNECVAFVAMARALGGKNVDGARVFDITRWNDAPGRTKAEATSAMRAVAATLRAQEREPEPVRQTVAA
jgi:hypothetical protein